MLLIYYYTESLYLTLYSYKSFLMRANYLISFLFLRHTAAHHTPTLHFQERLRAQQTQVMVVGLGRRCPSGQRTKVVISGSEFDSRRQQTIFCDHRVAGDQPRDAINTIFDLECIGELW